MFSPEFTVSVHVAQEERTLSIAAPPSAPYIMLMRFKCIDQKVKLNGQQILYVVKIVLLKSAVVKHSGISTF
jgi:hypothetical protein